MKEISPENSVDPADKTSFGMLEPVLTALTKMLDFAGVCSPPGRSGHFQSHRTLGATRSVRHFDQNTERCSEQRQPSTEQSAQPQVIIETAQLHSTWSIATAAVS